jgi:hypothetical protein
MDDNLTELKSKMTIEQELDQMIVRQIERFLNLINNREKKSNRVIEKEMETPMEIRDDLGLNKMDSSKLRKK